MPDAWVGNDVVDLCDPETQAHARHPRFDARVFRPAERALIAAAAAPERRRWQLWAAKEAAYKALCREAPGLRFRPVAFAVSLEDEAAAPQGELRARVRVGRHVVPVRVWTTAEQVHAVVGSPYRAATARLAAGETPSAGARRLALALARRLFPGEALHVERHGRVPRLVRASRATGPPELLPTRRVPLSLSHHGRFVACALAEGPA